MHSGNPRIQHSERLGYWATDDGRRTVAGDRRPAFVARRSSLVAALQDTHYAYSHTYILTCLHTCLSLPYFALLTHPTGNEKCLHVGPVRTLDSGIPYTGTRGPAFRQSETPALRAAELLGDGRRTADGDRRSTTGVRRSSVVARRCVARYRLCVLTYLTLLTLLTLLTRPKMKHVSK